MPYELSRKFTDAYISSRRFLMNTKNFSPLTTLSPIIVSLLFLIVASTNANAQTELDQAPVHDCFDYEAAADNSAFRWLAMARFYERHGMLNQHTDPDDALTFRWLAMARFYESHGMLNQHTDPDDALTFRWLAMARFYESHGLLNQHTDPDDALTFRWLAMARFYESHGLLNQRTDPDDALTFRWLAIARFYEENGLLTRPLTVVEEQITAASD